MCSLLEGKLSQWKSGPSEQGVDHHAETMSSDPGSNPGHQPLGPLRRMPGYMPLSLELGMDCFTQQAEAVAVLLSRCGTQGRLICLHRSQDLERVRVLEKAPEIRIVGGSFSQHACEMMRKRVQQLHDGLMIRGTGWREEETHDDPSEADDTVECAANVREGFPAPHSIVSRPEKITSVCAAFLSNARHRSGVHHGCFFQRLRIQDDLHTHSNGQDH